MNNYYYYYYYVKLFKTNQKLNSFTLPKIKICKIK